MDKLKDIKPIVDIPDNSLIYLIILTILLLIFLSFIVYLFIKKRKKNSINKKDLAIEKLKNLDFKNSKKTAYDFSYYGKFLVNDDNKQEFVFLEEKLTYYKYKKQVGNLDNNLIVKIREFVNA